MKFLSQIKFVWTEQIPDFVHLSIEYIRIRTTFNVKQFFLNRGTNLTFLFLGPD